MPLFKMTRTICLGMLLTMLSIVFCAAQDSTLDVKEARVLVTGADHKRPESFPGLGDFIGWPGGVERMPNGDLLLVTRRGKEHQVNPADPLLKRPNLLQRWLLASRFPAINSTDHDRKASG